MRSLCGALALGFWFYAIGSLPLALAMTLNYTSSVWMVLFVIASAVFTRQHSIRMPFLVTAAVGFGGIVLILQPTISQDLWIGGLVGLLSGLMSAVAFMQISASGKLAKPGYRVVFYFSLAGAVLGLAATLLWGGFTPHTWQSASLLLAMGVAAAGAQWSLTYAFSNGKTLANASLQYLTVAFSCALGALAFGEQVIAMAIGGMLLVVAFGILSACLQKE